MVGLLIIRLIVHHGVCVSCGAPEEHICRTKGFVKEICAIMVSRCTCRCFGQALGQEVAFASDVKKILSTKGATFSNFFVV